MELLLYTVMTLSS